MAKKPRAYGRDQLVQQKKKSFWRIRFWEGAGKGEKKSVAWSLADAKGDSGAARP